jgi:hypothetical protein
MIEVHPTGDMASLFIRNEAGFVIIERQGDGGTYVYRPTGDNYVVRPGEEFPSDAVWRMPRPAMASFMAALAHELGAVEPTREMSATLQREAGRVDKMLDTLIAIAAGPNRD